MPERPEIMEAPEEKKKPTIDIYCGNKATGKTQKLMRLRQDLGDQGKKVLIIQGPEQKPEMLIGYDLEYLLVDEWFLLDVRTMRACLKKAEQGTKIIATATMECLGGQAFCVKQIVDMEL